MNVLSLFDGMQCGRIALERAGIEVNRYYASEIDKHAVNTAQANYPCSIQLGDVTKWREWDIDWSEIDLLIGGSPCQGFSSAGKRGGTKALLDGVEHIVDSREIYIELKSKGAEFLSQSYLFWEYVLCLDHIKSKNPSVKFMLENVRMSNNNLDMISRALGVTPILVDSSICSPCDRYRFYWANWSLTKPNRVECDYMQCIDDVVLMSPGWNKWWSKSKEFQIKKKYSKLIKKGDKGLTMTARQYASWNGNFIETPDGIAKPGKITLAKLIGAPANYFKTTSQRQAELMSGNGWTVNVIAHFFKSLS